MKSKITISAALIAGASVAPLSPATDGMAAGDPITNTPAGIAVEATPDVPAKITFGETSLIRQVVLTETDEWTQRLETRFLRLAEKEAVGVLNKDEAKELERLSSLRNRLKVPRTGEEVLYEYKQRKLTSELLAALQKYVSFYAPSNRPKA